ncbi:hypothetical protein PV327_003034 [Microctonus hyperodae]|uniref:Pre-mRNA-splicing factor Syf1-like N-terminal HAT-repeats domain-containing protein n=1 Tax=Microctonus hyperodae TaxID=165561 RepID=A0AA39G411_MICHY|nr:hypothetical protein PV327_003034 [Microctonus hyperodae]
MQKVKTVQSKTTPEKLPSKMEEKNERPPLPLPTIIYSDDELLQEYDSARNQFEVNIKRNPFRISFWVKYADWEEKRKLFSRARSIYERALTMDYCNISLWLKYIDMELRNNQTSHAKKLLDRAVTMLPHVDQFWYKYVAVEQESGKHDNTSKVFERWMKWEPEEHAWYAYIKFESQLNLTYTTRGIYERLILVHPNVDNWIKYAKFEASCEHPKQARSVYKRATDFFLRDNNCGKLYISFAQFEEQRYNISRARCIYKFGLKHTAKEHSEELTKAYELHKEKYSNESISQTHAKTEIDLKKNTLKYLVQQFPYRYVHWFDYINIIENEGDNKQTRRVYEKAIQNKPSRNDIESWRVYMYLWIYYASFEESDAKDIKRSRILYKKCLNIIPDDMIMFTKVWLYYAEFEVRQKNYSVAREALGCSMGVFSCEKLAERYQRMKLEFEKHNKRRIKNKSSLNESISR